MSGLEVKLCSSKCIYGLFLGEIVVLIWMQIVYFKSQEYQCLTRAPEIYFWLMVQIICLYFAIMMCICYFMRKFCSLDEDADDKFQKVGKDGDIENKKKDDKA